MGAQTRHNAKAGASCGYECKTRFKWLQAGFRVAPGGLHEGLLCSAVFKSADVAKGLALRVRTTGKQSFKQRARPVAGRGQLFPIKLPLGPAPAACHGAADSAAMSNRHKAVSGLGDAAQGSTALPQTPHCNCH